MLLRRTAVGVVLVGLLAVGCTAGESTQEPTEQPSPWPLTGLPGYPEGSQAQVVVVKVDDSAAGRPQVGLAVADLVVQQMVEGGATRLAAMYLSSYPTEVEPVRSMRRTDIGIVGPTGGTLVASGGEAATIAAIEAAGIPVATEGAPGFSRDPARRAPYNLVVDVAALAATLPDGPPPGPYLSFGPVPADAVGEPASAVELAWRIGGSAFEWDPGTQQWRRVEPAGEDLSFTSVIALTLDVEFLGGNDASGTPIPTMVTEGTGTGLIATGGRAYDITWTKAGPDDPWQFTHLPEGASEPQAFTVPPGRTWLALVPPEGDVAVEPGPSAAPTASQP
jgi:hypothetical protein